MPHPDTKEARSFRADHVKLWLDRVGLKPDEVEDRALAALFVAADEKWCDLQAAMVEPNASFITPCAVQDSIKGEL